MKTVTEPGMTETDMRAAEPPQCSTTAALATYVDSLVDRPHDYGTCVYAMSLAAVAAFEFVALRLGVTGFQASCADLDVLRRTRRLKGPAMLIDGEKALYPQYDLVGQLLSALEAWRPWLRDEAKRLLANDATLAHPDVIKHWQLLAAHELVQVAGGKADPDHSDFDARR